MKNQALRFIDPAELARISDLQLLARTVVQGLLSGLHTSPKTGASIEFAQYRPYTQGDDPRFVDWRLYGRTDRLHIKQFQDETNLRCTVLLDCSASMNYSSGGITKFRYAQMLAACLIVMLKQQHDAAGFIGYHESILSHVPPRAHPNQARRILVELENLECAGATDTTGALRYLGDVLLPRGMVVLISDLLHPQEETVEHLRSLRARRHDVLVLQITDPAERDFSFDRTITLVDAEDGREQYTVPEAVREEYLANRAHHFDSIRHECLAAEIDIAEFATDEPLDKALHHFMHHRNSVLITSSRRGRGSAKGGS
jgi:uncharacterized protein (DUF58 family)